MKSLNNAMYYTVNKISIFELIYDIKLIGVTHCLGKL